MPDQATNPPGRATLKVGVVATHVPPALGYGGVAVTAGILTHAWASQGHHVSVVASDESTAGRLQPKDVEMGEGNAVRLYRSHLFRRWGFGLGAIPALFRLCRESDAVYIHGIATWPCTLAGLFCAVLGKRFVVALHGGLMPEHVALIRARKPHKWLYYRLLSFPALRRAAAIHCTSATESAGARAVLGDQAPILQVPNGVEYRQLEVAPAPAGPGLKLCFLGHVQQEKGINGFIRAWLQVRRPEDRLVVAGRSVDAGYFREFQELLERAGGSVEYRGYLPKAEVNRLLADSHFLVLPSGLEECGGMRENFGNVVAEALALGRPVLVARGLAWDGVEAARSGFLFERSEQSACAALRRAQELTPEQWAGISRKARAWVERRLDPVRLGEKVWKVLTGASTGARQTWTSQYPDTVFAAPAGNRRRQGGGNRGAGFAAVLGEEACSHD